MSIKVQCGQCAKRFAALEKLGGKRVKCPQCGWPMEIPAAAVESEMAALPNDPLGSLLDEELADKPGTDGGDPSAATDERPAAGDPLGTLPSSKASKKGELGGFDVELLLQKLARPAKFGAIPVIVLLWALAVMFPALRAFILVVTMGVIALMGVVGGIWIGALWVVCQVRVFIDVQHIAEHWAEFSRKGKIPGTIVCIAIIYGMLNLTFFVFLVEGDPFKKLL